MTNVNSPIFTGISERKPVQEKLKADLRQQKLLADLSSRFVALPSEEVDAAIEDTQGMIVKTMEIDRSTLWQYEDGMERMVITHYWQRLDWGVLPKFAAAHNLFSWVTEMLLRGEPVYFSKVDELPPEAAQDAEAFRAYSVKSSVIMPLIAKGQLFGAVTFATLSEEHCWQEEEISELKLIAQIIGTVVARQRADKRAEQLREELTHSTRVAALGEMVSALAHELNQPLAAILSNAQAARRFLNDGIIEPEELLATLDDIIRDDKRASSVIHNLRAMLSKRTPVRELCCLNELVREALELLHGELLGVKVEVHSMLSGHLSGVNVARVELHQILVNILINAGQAMKETPPEHRRIEIETSTGVGGVRITVRDHGCGIPHERLKDVFSPFYTTKESGLGMGLSICRRIVENYGGKIDAHNHADGGAIFSISLPAAVGSGVTS